MNANPLPAAGGRGAPAIPPAPPTRSLLSRFRSVLLTSMSFVLTFVVIGNAYFQRQQFYPSVVYITKSNPSMAVICVQAFVFVILFGKLMRKIFFGHLRAAEFEHLMERSWYAVTETCLAFTVFKDDFSPKFVALFTLLLFLKSFHWLSEERVDFMERSPTISALFHLRVVSLNLLLAMVDFQFVMHAYTSTLTKGPSVQLVFGFEYAILMTIVTNTIIKYILRCVDLYSENPWENKAVFMLYTELVIGFVKVILYLVFIAIMVRIYTLPLFAVRPMYLTMRAFRKALNDVILSRRAIHNMNTLYPDATEEELAATDNVCIICREEMVASPSTKKLPCNHIFHKNCLRSWFQRQQTCPTCRLDVLRSPLARNLHRQGQPGAAPAPPRPGQAPPPPAGPNGNPFDPQHFFAQMAAAFPPPQVPPQAQQAATTQGSQTATSTTTTNTSTSQTSSNQPRSPPNPSFVPPFFPPPFPFFTPPFSVPPPMPPANFSGLTQSELEAMEGNERENLEARIRCLRNIRVLLDAAVLEMQQYTNVINGLNRTGAMSQSPPPPRPAAPTPDSASRTPTVTPTEASGAKPKVKAATKNEEENIIEKMDQTEERQTPDKEDEKSDDPNEIRRRRLAKFET